MTVSTIGVADATSPDKYLHTSQRTISGTAREDQIVLPGQNVYETYTVASTDASIATANDHVLQIMGDGSAYARLVRLRIQPTSDIPAAASVATFAVYRLSSAGSGGTSLTPGAHDSSDTYGGGAMKLPTSKGTEGALLEYFRLPIPASLGDRLQIVDWQPSPYSKPVIFGTATSDGIAIKSITAVASCAVDVIAEFIVTSYL